MIEADLILAVRNNCGKLQENTEELEDTDITSYSGRTLSKIAEYCPIVRLRYIESVDETVRDFADRGEYDVHANTNNVIKVFPWDSIEERYTDPAMSGTIIGVSKGDEYYNWPSLWRINAQRKQRGLSRFRWRYDRIRGKLIISPYPNNAGDKYWYFSIENDEWTLANLPTEFEDLHISGITWRALEQVAMARSRLGGVHRDGGFVVYPATEIHRIAQDYKDEFMQELKRRSKLWMMDF